MKKYLSIIISLICILSLTACGRKDTYEIEISIPAGSTEEFVYSDEEIMPIGDQITIYSGAGLGDTEVILKPVNETTEAGYVGEYLTHGMPVELDAVKGEWFKIGVSVQNDSDKGPIAVSVKVEGVEVRIADDEEMASQETITYNGITRKKSELCDQTLQYLELTEEEKMFSSYLPPEFMIFEETWGITLTAENITSTSLTLVCTQSGGEPTGELQTGSWYILENWTQENGWKEVPHVNADQELAWTEEAWMIPLDSANEWEVNWGYIYGELSAGKYRIGKEIMDFRGTGDYDNAIYFAEFEIPSHSTY